MSNQKNKNIWNQRALTQFMILNGLTAQSSFTGKPLQKTTPMARLVGNYKPSSVVSKIKKPVTPKKSSGLGIFDVNTSFLNIPNHKLSLLVPEVRLYRVEENGYKPFYFPVTTDYNFTDDGMIDFSKPFTSHAAVLKSFNINFVGNNPFTVGKGMIEADLQIDVDALSVLFDLPEEIKNSYAQLADLITMRVPESKRIPNSGKKPEIGALKAGRSLQIAATIGYSYTDTQGILTTEERKAIDETKMLMSLYYKGRSISFQQNGSATISAQYHGHLESGDKDFIFNLVEKARVKQKLLDIRTATNKAKAASKKDEKDIKKAQPGDEKKPEKGDSQKSVDEKPNHLTGPIEELSKVFDLLHKRSKIYSFNFHVPERYQVAGQAAPTKEAGAPKPPPSKKPAAASDDMASLEQILQKYMADHVHFVYFGDLIDAFVAKMAERDFGEIRGIIKQLQDAKQIDKKTATAQLKELQEGEQFLKRMYILFGDLTIRVKGPKEEEISVNAADIPISLDSIYSAIYEDFVKPRKYFFGLKEFFTPFCSSLINKSLSEVSGSDLFKKVRVNVITVPGQKVSSRNMKDGEVDIKHLRTADPGSITSRANNSAQYVIFHQAKTIITPHAGSGIASLDAAEGIVHLRTSQDRGLVKEINFSAIQVPGLEEYLIVGHGNAHDALRIPHNATVNMYGNNLFIPGMEVYIDPNSLGFGDPRDLDSAARKLGIGGYYSITKVSTSFSGGVLTTNLQCQFAGYPESLSEPKRKDFHEARGRAGDSFQSIAKAAVGLRKKPDK